MDWMEITVTVSSEGEEAVTDLFYRAGSQGVAVEAPRLIQDYIDAGVWDYHAFGDVKLTGRCAVKGYFPDDERLAARLIVLRDDLVLLRQQNPDWYIDSDSIMVREEDWANEWKKYFKPIHIGERFMIKPTWEELSPNQSDNRLVIEIDPGMAFGTGTHPTTSLCLRAIPEYVRGGMLVFDIGTGSGILAIASAKLGAQVQAGDIDTMAVNIACENAALNQLAERIDFKAGNLGEVFTTKADVVIANIIADVIIELLPELKYIMKPDGVFMASGIIDMRADDVIEEMQRVGLDVIKRFDESGWVLLAARWASP